MYIKHFTLFPESQFKKNTGYSTDKPKIDFHPFSKNPQKRNAKILSTYELLNILFNKKDSYKLSVLLYHYKNIFSIFVKNTAN